jgi:hypothetical protein
MSVPRPNCLLFLTLAAAVGAPALGQTQAVGPGAGGAQSGASIPDFSGVWRHASLPGFEPPASGPGPVTNRSRLRNGVSDWNQLVGDYTNPILKPHAAEIVKQHGDISLKNVVYPTPVNQCWPGPVPFIFMSFGMEMLQQPDKVTILYAADHEFRQVRLNRPHPAEVTPSWYGDSVGHYEGDTLVVDTVGVRTDRPLAMVDMYGTPYSAALHVVERYRLLGYEAAKEGLDRDARENLRVPNDINRNYRGKHLQLRFTVEDAGVFTMPWSATVTYGQGSGDWDEEVCAENTHEYYYNKNSDVPRADKPDF